MPEVVIKLPNAWQYRRNSLRILLFSSVGNKSYMQNIGRPAAVSHYGRSAMYIYFSQIFIPTLMVKFPLWTLHFHINLHGHPQIFLVSLLRILTISADNSYTYTNSKEIRCRTNALFELDRRKYPNVLLTQKACQAVDGAVAKGDVDLTLIVDLRRIREGFSG